MSTEVDNSSRVDRLQAIWDETLPAQPEMGARVIARYAEPQRRYHTTEHLAVVQDRITEFASADHDLFLVRLAGFYHDAIYDIPFREITNEEASARLSRRGSQPGRARAGGPQRGGTTRPADRHPRAGLSRSQRRAALRRRPGGAGRQPGGVRGLCRRR